MSEPPFQAPEAFSLLGKPLYPAPLRPETREKQEALYAEALESWRNSPEDPDTIIWLGRRTAYLGRHREAIAIYTRGIELHPEDPRLYRHRGHRFITLRRFQLAASDLEKAAGLTEGKPDEVEPDGLPNERGIPVSSLQFNIWYHLGLAYYLQSQYVEAAQAYHRCMEVSDLDDKKVATTHWLYMSLRRLGMAGEARKLLEDIHPEMDIIENTQYHRCLLMYQGRITAEELLEEARRQGALGLVTTGYGVANWYLCEGRVEAAQRLLGEILVSDSWAGFGYIAAEADVVRLGWSPT